MYLSTFYTTHNIWFLRTLANSFTSTIDLSATTKLSCVSLAIIVTVLYVSIVSCFSGLAGSALFLVLIS